MSTYGTDLETALRRMSGLARVSALVDLGFSRRAIERELRAGRIRRPQRGWVALPSADPILVFAARHHVVLSCVTQATRLGLWVVERPEAPHVAAPNPGAKVRAPGMVVHWGRAPVPRRPYLLQDPLENVLVHVAGCQPRESALTIWESALQQGRTEIGRMRTLPLDGRARQLLSACTPFSDSGLETLVSDRLRWLRIPIRKQVDVSGRRVDLLIGARLIVEIDGSSHTGPQRDRDNAYDAMVLQLGYRVIRLSYAQVMHR